MLRITVHAEPQSITFQLEGRLTEPWVQEAENCWRTSPPPPGSVVHLDLTGVTGVDARGKALLAAAAEAGADLRASGCLMRAIVAEITGRSHADAATSPSKNSSRLTENCHE